MSTITRHQFTNCGEELKNEDIEYGCFITLKSAKKNKKQKIAGGLVTLLSLTYLSITPYMNSNASLCVAAIAVLSGLLTLLLKDGARKIVFNSDGKYVDGLKMRVGFSDISHIEVSKDDTGKMHCVSLVLMNENKLHVVKSNAVYKMHYFARKIAAMTSSKLCILG